MTAKDLQELNFRWREPSEEFAPAISERIVISPYAYRKLREPKDERPTNSQQRALRIYWITCDDGKKYLFNEIDVERVLKGGVFR